MKGQPDDDEPQEEEQPSPAAVQDDATFDPSYDFSGFPVAEISTVDFHDGFTYVLHGYGQISVVNGAGQIALADNPNTQQVALVVVDVRLGDAGDDGIEEAVVTLSARFDDSEPSSYVQVFAVIDGTLQLVGSRSVGDLASVEISDAGLIVERWMATSGASPDRIERTEWVLLSGTERFRIGAQYPSRPYRNLNNLTERSGEEILFSPGTKTAVLDATNHGVVGTVRFAGQGGTMVRVKVHDGSDVTLRIRHEADGALVGDAREGADVPLRTDGRYTATVIFDHALNVKGAQAQKARVEFAIADQRTLAAPTWTTQASGEITGVADREVSVEIPQFVTAHQNVDLSRVNATIERLAAERVAAHNDLVAATCAEDEPAIYDLTYRPTLISYDLVSIHFEEFVCLCADGDAFNSFSVTMDLNTGEVVRAADIIQDYERARSIWWEAAQGLNAWAFTDVSATIAPSSLEFTTSLSPFGLSLTVQPDQVEGLPYALTVELDFDELEGVVDQSIAARAETGATIILPYEDGCGC